MKYVIIENLAFLPRGKARTSRIKGEETLVYVPLVMSGFLTVHSSAVHFVSFTLQGWLTFVRYFYPFHSLPVYSYVISRSTVV